MKILISFLGTGAVSQKSGQALREYRKAKYAIDGKMAGESPFVSSVLMDYYQYDGLILIGTVKSMWEEVYRYFSKKNNIDFNEDTYFKIADQIEKSNHTTPYQDLDLQPVIKVLKGQSNAVVIPYGLNHKEQVEIFSQIAKALHQIQSGDEIILDVTHSFRSLPLFTTTIINYIHSLTDKNLTFSKIYYGMLDAMSEFEGIAPIIDISTTLDLQKWTTAAYSFKEYGKGQLLADLLDGEEGKIIQIFSDAVNLNYLSEIQQKLANFHQLAQKGFRNEFAQWVIPQVLESFTKRLNKAGTTQHLFQYELSVWHREKQNYGSAYIVFVEGVITYICEKAKVDWKSKVNRENAKNVILTFDNNHQKQPFKLNLNTKVQSEIRNIYTEANHIRNNIAHNLSRRINKAQADISKLIKFQNSFYKIIKTPSI